MSFTYFVQPVESTRADKQNVSGIHLKYEYVGIMEVNLPYFLHNRSINRMLVVST